LGINGNTSTDILNRFKKESEARNPTDIVFAFGVNDSGYFKTMDNLIVPEDVFTRNVEELIDLAKSITSNITFIGLTLGDDKLLKPLPQSSRGKSYDLNRVKIYDEKIKRIAEDNFCKYVPLTNMLEESDFMDGLHPNDQGHRKMFEVIKNYF
jgi:lysophospholipase L1-like esterase